MTTITTMNMLIPLRDQSNPHPQLSPQHCGYGPTARTYSGPEGSIVAVQLCDIPQLQARGWVLLPLSGNSASRPSRDTGGAFEGLLYFNTDSSELLVLNGTGPGAQ